jgi:hypothetical protein
VKPVDHDVLYDLLAKLTHSPPSPLPDAGKSCASTL